MGTKIKIYADDLLFYIIADWMLIQPCIDELHRWSQQRGLSIHEGKTKVIKFRRGGRLAAHDKFYLNGVQLQVTNSYEYLGITMQTTLSFSVHVSEVSSKAVKAMHGIENPRLLSIDTAMKLFTIKIQPVLTYAIRAIWSRLTAANLRNLDLAYDLYIKRVLGVSKYAKNRLTRALVGTVCFTEKIIKEMNLPVHDEVQRHLHVVMEKRGQIAADFYETPAMTQQIWKGPAQEMRHAVTRQAVHGFHHLICGRRGFHEAGEGCMCVLCGQQATLYHLVTCEQNQRSLLEWAAM
jgi:hypothetical protein